LSSCPDRNLFGEIGKHEYRMPPLSSGYLPTHWASSARPWQVDAARRQFVSPAPHRTDDEFLIAERVADNGWIGSRLELPKKTQRDAGFVFRHQGEHEAHIAGIGGWDSGQNASREGLGND
jgi:hypothetical protein